MERNRQEATQSHALSKRHEFVQPTSATKSIVLISSSISDEYDTVKRDILKTDPLPSVEEAYSQIRSEAHRHAIMKGGGDSLTKNSATGIGSLALRTERLAPVSGDFIARKERRGRSEQGRVAPPYSSSRCDDRKVHLRCSHCGGIRHIEEGCFHWIGYLEW